MSLSNVHPSNIKTLNYYIKVFKPALEDYHLAHTSYSVDKFFQLEVHKQGTHYYITFDTNTLLYFWLYYPHSSYFIIVCKDISKLG
jgi:hypothetical protein